MLTSIADLHGNVTQLTYADGQLDRVTSEDGRYLRVRNNATLEWLEDGSYEFVRKGRVDPSPS